MLEYLTHQNYAEKHLPVQLFSNVFEMCGGLRTWSVCWERCDLLRLLVVHVMSTAS